MVLYHKHGRCDNVFVVLRIITPEKSVSKRLRQRKALKKSALVSHSTEKALPFFTLDVLSEKQGINWKNVAEKCGRYSSRIVAPRSVHLPDMSGLRRFVPQTMSSHLIFNTALETVEKSRVEPTNLCITVTDRGAVYFAKICDLLPLASCVRVITDHPERYASACIKAFEEYGASLVIRSSYEAVSMPEIIISSDGAVSSKMKDAVIFSPKRKSCGKLVVFGSGVRLSESHLSVIGEDIDSVDFAGALTELCGSSEYRNSVFEKPETTCGKCVSSSAEKCLLCRLSVK